MLHFLRGKAPSWRSGWDSNPRAVTRKLISSRLSNYTLLEIPRRFQAVLSASNLLCHSGLRRLIQPHVPNPLKFE